MSVTALAISNFSTRVVAFGLAGLLFSAGAAASVVVTGTRVIYPGNASEHTVHLTNQDDTPNVVQAWVDVNNPESTPAHTDAPFIVTPPVFRMEPKAGHSLRIVYTGEGLPQDRESVFYLNVLQIPPIKQAHAEHNKLHLLQRHRLKLFYRPKGLAGTPEDVPGRLQFTLAKNGADWTVQTDNPTAYFASIGSCTLSAAGQRWPVKASMVAPFTKASWPVKPGAVLPAGAIGMKCTLVTDHGAYIDVVRDLAREGGQ